MLVNRTKGLSEDFVPSNLVDVHSECGTNIRVEATAYDNWLKLKEKVKEMGYIIDIESAYRSYNRQAEVLKELIEEKGEEYAKNAVAPPGHSEHQTGLAVDYLLFKDDKFLIDTEMYGLKEIEEINDIVHKYGFIIRYPSGKEHITGYKHEPWHLRYVGEELATSLYEKGLTLDEYYC